MPTGTPDLQALRRRAAEVQLGIVKAMGPGQFHHFGGSLSAADIIVALYFHAMRIRPDQPDWPERDRFVLSKGHSVPALYVCLAHSGFFPASELPTLKRFGSNLQGHPDMRKTCGLEANTGSLGMGLSVANGMALAARATGLGYRVYALLGDGECQEGQVWEAAMTAAHHRLDDLTVIVDRNELQAMGKTEDRMGVEPLAAKWKAFGWHVSRNRWPRHGGDLRRTSGDVPGHRPTCRDHRSHHQGKGRVVHGRSAQLPQRGYQRRAIPGGGGRARSHYRLLGRLIDGSQ